MANEFELRLPFATRGASGEVSVSVDVVRDPTSVGFNLLPLPFGLELAKGFPVCRARVTFSGQGYAGVFGWIQFLETTPVGGSVRREVDLMPMQYGTGWPFLAHGEHPTFVDAPANPDRDDESWRAFAFLCEVPDVAFTRALRPLAGFEWGYDLTSKRPRVVPPRSVPSDTALTFEHELHAECPGWPMSL